MTNERKSVTYFCAWVSVVVGILLVFDNLFGVLLSDLAFAHLLADSRIELTHLAALSHRIAMLVQVL